MKDLTDCLEIIHRMAAQASKEEHKCQFNVVSMRHGPLIQNKHLKKDAYTRNEQIHHVYVHV